MEPLRQYNFPGTAGYNFPSAGDTPALAIVSVAERDDGKVRLTLSIQRVGELAADIDFDSFSEICDLKYDMGRRIKLVLKSEVPPSA